MRFRDFARTQNDGRLVRVSAGTSIVPPSPFAPPREPSIVFLAALVLLAPAGVRGQVGQGSFGSNDPFQARFRQQSHFEIKINPVKPGGPVRITADKENCGENLTVCTAQGGVEIDYQDIKITADEVTYDRRQDIATARGHVVMDQGPTRISGAQGQFHLKSQTGYLTQAQADLQPEFHIVADRISKVGPSTYEIQDGLFTACGMPNPPWSFYTKEARITLDDYARMKSVTFRVKKLPLLFSPYLLWPTTRDRKSGFLVPGFGFNNKRGAYLGLTYYWVTGRSTDATTELDAYSSGTLGIGQELRWAPSAESAGVFQGFLVRDKDAQICGPGTVSPFSTSFCVLPGGTGGVYQTEKKTRWKLRLDHTSSDLPWDIRGVVSIRDYSDYNYLQDFERSFALNFARQIQSTAFLTKNFGDDSVNLRMDRTEAFLNNDILLERLPSLEYSHRTSEIAGSPFYLQMDSSLSNFFVNRGTGALHGSYGRADFHPIVSLPIKGIPWLSITAKGGYRATWYSDSATSETQSSGPAAQSFSGNSLTRRDAEAGLSIDGPSFSRIFDFQLGPFTKWKHIIEPRMDYNYVGNIQDIGEVPLFDDVDQVFGQNGVRVSLLNHLLAKGGGENAAPAQEVATLTLSELLYLQNPEPLTAPTGTLPYVSTAKRQPINADLRIAPAPQFNLDASANYDPTASRATSYSLTAGATWGDEYAGLGWSATRPVITSAVSSSPYFAAFNPNGSTINARAGVYLFSKNWRLDTVLNYDAQQHRMREDRSLLEYSGSCYKVYLEVRNLYAQPGTGILARHDYRVVINLKNIGTLLDLNGGIDKFF